MHCGGFYCSKNALAALNILYLLVSIALMSIAGYGYWVAVITSIGVFGGLIACGVFLFFVALMGLLGALKHHQVLLFFYMIILFLIFLLQFALACVCLAMNDTQINNLIQGSWIKASSETKAMVQSKLQCCGFQSESTSEGLDHPSCGELQCCQGYINTTLPLCCQSGNINSTQSESLTPSECKCDNCWMTIHTSVNRILKMAGGVGLFFSFTEICGVWMAWRYRNQKDPRANPNAFL